MKKIILFVLVLMVMTACSGKASSPATSVAGEWTLTSYGSSTNPTPADSNVDTSITFDSDGKLTGNVGCNGFGGDYKVDGGTITFGSIVSTMMACADPIMQQEGTVLNVFTNSATFKVDGNTLTIKSTDGNSVVILEHK
jgi:heat shock protein HslJ